MTLCGKRLRRRAPRRARSRRGDTRRVCGLLVIAATAATACGQASAHTDPAAFLIIPRAQRIATPVLAGRTLDGERLSGKQFEGRVAVVNVWGSWCAPCRAEASALAAAAHRLMPPVGFLGLDVKDNPASARAFASKYQIPYPSLQDPSYRLAASIPGASVSAVPTTLVLDRRGRVAAVHFGAIRLSSLLAAVATVSGET